MADQKARGRWQPDGATLLDCRRRAVDDEPELEMTSGPLCPGDVFVVCSDGLTNHVQQDEILHCVNGALPQPACDALIALTLARGARDNVTVVIARYRADGSNGADRMPDTREQAQ